MGWVIFSEKFLINLMTFPFWDFFIWRGDAQNSLFATITLLMQLLREFSLFVDVFLWLILMEYLFSSKNANYLFTDYIQNIVHKPVVNFEEM